MIITSKMETLSTQRGGGGSLIHSGWRGVLSIGSEPGSLPFFPWTRNFTPYSLSLTRCINRQS